MSATQQTVRSTYRTLARLIEQLPTSQKNATSRSKAIEELRSKFRKPLAASETFADRLKQANDRISFLRITTPKSPNDKTRTGGGGVFVQTKDGKILKVEDVETTTRDANGRVISNWDGKNMDPCMVKRHKVGLRRAGFVNNMHAKGVF